MTTDNSNFVKSVKIKAEIETIDYINLYLDLILIWNNNKHPDKTAKINEYVKRLRELILND